MLLYLNKGNIIINIIKSEHFNKLLINRYLNLKLIPLNTNKIYSLLKYQILNNNQLDLVVKD